MCYSIIKLLKNLLSCVTSPEVDDEQVTDIADPLLSDHVTETVVVRKGKSSNSSEKEDQARDQYHDEIVRQQPASDEDEVICYMGRFGLPTYHDQAGAERQLGPEQAGAERQLGPDQAGAEQQLGPDQAGAKQQRGPEKKTKKNISVVSSSTEVVPEIKKSNSSIVTRSLGLYNSDQTILLVGEGDFSFSASLAIAFGSASNMIATSLNQQKFLLENYSNAEANIAELRKRGCVVKHKVNATTMSTTYKLLASKKFDRIIFNFPHAGFTCKRESEEDQIKVHQALVRGFLAKAKKMINKENGQIHITHKCNGFHAKWSIDSLALSEGLSLLQDVPFKLERYPGYHTKYGFGGDKGFNCKPSRTYIFVVKE